MLEKILELADPIWSYIQPRILEYQTLITGFLAIAAAAWTIRTMNVNEAAAQLRHEQSSSQTVRPDKLRVDRAFALIDDFEAAHEEVANLSGIFSSNPKAAEDLVCDYHALFQLVQPTKFLLSHHLIEQSITLFDGETMLSREKALAASILISDKFGNLPNTLNVHGSPDETELRRKASEVVDDTKSDLSTVVEHTGRFIAGLKKAHLVISQ